MFRNIFLVGGWINEMVWVVVGLVYLVEVILLLNFLWDFLIVSLDVWLLCIVCERKVIELYWGDNYFFILLLIGWKCLIVILYLYKMRNEFIRCGKYFKYLYLLRKEIFCFCDLRIEEKVIGEEGGEFVIEVDC